jgi:poly-gamma-glutamate synthesis protein (capsule biosynthesis protein)
MPRNFATRLVGVGPGGEIVAIEHRSHRALEREDLEAMRRSIHWGPNWSYDVPEQHRRFAHGLIDLADISIVHGHSSHHPIGIEVYRDRLVLYGCGDFLNDYEGIRGYEEFRGDLSLMYFAKVDLPSGRLLGLEMMPLQMRRFRLNQATSEDAEWLRRTLDRESRRFGASVGGASGDQLVLHWSGRSAAVQETEPHVRSR